MLLHVIFAFNKRAQIYKEEEKNYSYKYYDGYNNREKYERLKQEAYNCKKELLEFLEPSAIHKIIKIRKKYKIFIVVKEIEKKEKLFLYYSFNGFKFHVPISELKDTLEVIQVDNIASEVVDEKNLLSIQFCKKVYAGLNDRKLILMI